MRTAENLWVALSTVLISVILLFISVPHQSGSFDTDESFINARYRYVAKIALAGPYIF
jgi:hypothetical protein